LKVKKVRGKRHTNSKQKLVKLKGNRQFKIVVGEFNISPSKMDRTPKQKIS